MLARAWSFLRCDYFKVPSGSNFSYPCSGDWLFLEVLTQLYRTARHYMLVSSGWWMSSLHPQHLCTELCSHLFSAPWPCPYCSFSHTLLTVLMHLFDVPQPGLAATLLTPALSPFQPLCCGVSFSMHIFPAQIWTLAAGLLSYLSPDLL